MSDESASSNQQQKKQRVSSMSTRRLTSFSPPDLEILVGPEKRIYRYHALILASYSTYVDTILSTPMAVQNQQEKCLNFPDIPEETWEAMISYLEPGGYGRLIASTTNVQMVLPFYDKYEFTDGLAMCDSLISQLLLADIEVIRELSVCSRYKLDGGLLSLAVAASDLNMPTAGPVAAVWAAKVLMEVTPDEESTIKMLLPLVENNEKMLQLLVRTIKCRHYTDMTLDDIKKLTKEDSFPVDILLKTQQIQEIEEILKKVHVGSVSLYLPRHADRGNLIGGYTRNGAEIPHHNRGAMRYVYKKKNADGNLLIISIKALDGFGFEWEISSSDVEEHEDDDLLVDEPTEMHVATAEAEEQVMPADVHLKRRVLYRWDCGYSSPIPPKIGWKTVKGRPSDLALRYL
jgi:BTB/POZ domain